MNNEPKDDVDELYVLDYFKRVPRGDKANFLLALRIEMGGCDNRWYKRFAAWRQVPMGRRLSTNEYGVMVRLTTDEGWRDTLKSKHILI